MWKQWVKDRRSGVYCPFKPPNTVLVGMNYKAKKPPGEVVGEFWLDEDHNIHVKLYETATKKEV
ncbi:MAG: hypothetical protein ACXAEN_17860 [Candidatus Thorarchaeota archaeon]|jgi:hypothetical protein